MMLPDGIEQAECRGMRFDQADQRAGAGVPSRGNQTGLAAGRVQVVQQQGQSSWFVGIVHPDFQTKRLQTFTTSLFGDHRLPLGQAIMLGHVVVPKRRVIQRRWGADLDRQSQSQPTERNLTVLGLTASLGCFSNDSGGTVLQEHAATGLVAMLASGPTSSLGPQIALFQQRFSGQR